MNESRQLCIELKDLYFHGHHGLFEEERIAGNEFIVDLSVYLQPAKEPLTRIDQTVNYTRLFELVKEEMEKPRDLLETLAMEIADAVHHHFDKATEIRIRVTKTRIPVTGMSGKVSVTYNKKIS